MIRTSVLLHVPVVPHKAVAEVSNKLRWYPQQPRRFIFTSLSEACCEAKRWKPSAEPIEPDPALHQRFPKPPFPQPSPEPC